MFMFEPEGLCDKIFNKQESVFMYLLVYKDTGYVTNLVFIVNRCTHTVTSQFYVHFVWEEKVTFKDAFDSERPVSVAQRPAPLQTEAQSNRSIMKLHCYSTIWTDIHSWKTSHTKKDRS